MSKLIDCTINCVLILRYNKLYCSLVLDIDYRIVENIINQKDHCYKTVGNIKYER